MDDALRVGGLDGVSDLRGDGKRVVERDRTLRDPLGQRRSVDELHHERVNVLRILDAVDVGDVRMVERREDLRFDLKPGEPLRVCSDAGRQGLDGDIPV